MAEEKGNAVSFTSLWDCFDKVVAHADTSRNEVKEVRHYLLARAILEQKYGDDLQKTMQHSFTPTTPTLSACWTGIKTAISTLSKLHTTFAHSLNTEICPKLAKTKDEMKIQISKMKSQHDSLVSAVKSKKSAHDKARNKYESAHKAAESAITNRDSAIRDNANEKTMGKVQSQVTKQLKEVETTEKNYTDAVDSYEKSQTEYDTQLTILLQQFERIDRNRLAMTVEALSAFTASHETIQTAEVDLCRQIRTATNKIDVDKEIDTFIRFTKTGKQREPHIIKHILTSQLISKELGNDSMVISSSVQSPAINNVSSTGGKWAFALFDYSSSQPEDLCFKEKDRIKIIDEVGEGWLRGEIGGRIGILPATYVQFEGIKNAGQAPSLPPPTSTVEKKCKAIYDFPAESSDELSFKEGDIITITGEYDDWYLGVLNGKSGIFPANYVEVLAGTMTASSTLAAIDNPASMSRHPLFSQSSTRPKLPQQMEDPDDANWQ